MKKVLSYGGGVQTFAMLVMIEQGILEKPDFAIFSDTVAEYPETYEHIEKVAKPIFEKLGIPFIQVQHENGLIEGYKSKNSIPMAGFRSCTTKYKIDPIRRYLSDYLGSDKKRGKASIETWIGISTDEARRAIPVKDQSPKWILNTYPLLELNYSRNDLIKLIEESGHPLPRKSGCFLCPYSGMKGFTGLKLSHPQLFEVALEMENLYFKNRPQRRSGFINSSGIRLQTINDFKTLDLFFDELPDDSSTCEGEGGCFL